jgi:hypothetical protein
LALFSAGTYDLAQQSVLGPCYGFTVTWDLPGWSVDPGVVVDFTVLVSQDAGLTWKQGGGAQVRGPGPFFNRDGSTSVQGSFSAQSVAHQYDGSGKFVKLASIWTNVLLIKVQMTVRNGTVQTVVNLDVVRQINQQANVPDLHHSIGVGVHSSAHGGTSVTSITTVGVTTTTGSVGVVDGLYYTGFDPGGGFPAFSSFSDFYGNVWTTAVTEHANANAVKARQARNYAIVGGAGHTFTLTVTNTSSFPAIAFTEITGAAATALDKTATGTDASGTSHSTSATATLSQAAELILLFGGITGVATGSVSAPWTQLENLTNDASTEGLITAYQIVAATTAVSGAFTTNNSVATENHLSTWMELLADLLSGQICL